MISFSNSGQKHRPSKPVSYELDSHLILNALNHLNLQIYDAVHREVPLVAIISDYIKAEHTYSMFGFQAKPVTISEEWDRCKALLALHGALISASISCSENGAFQGRSTGALFQVGRLIFRAWSAEIAGKSVELLLEEIEEGIALSASIVADTETRGRDGGFLNEALQWAEGQGIKIPPVRVIRDSRVSWRLVIATEP
ncbi:hypothetical protein [Variovorax saccharolyticus]|uniref:hypothetical protein n=1 Tax=Variovorax saccharolyticus TaxID=3053516 RepID=UPI0025787DA8|nr:hypothetical protein [Variovorax sp. J31P216]MDM0030198.1 hypothetical protein [Variovorax sp. J31P216]